MKNKKKEKIIRIDCPACMAIPEGAIAYTAHFYNTWYKVESSPKERFLADYFEEDLPDSLKNCIIKTLNQTYKKGKNKKIK